MGLRELQLNNVRLATPSEVDKVRYPDLLITDGYLNDPIEFEPDSRFEPKTVVDQFTELPNQISRDFAEFLQIDRNSDNPQLLTINMFSGLYRRDLFTRVFGRRAEFTELGVTR